MPFAYYKRLTAQQRRIYDRSDSVTSLKLPQAASLRPLVQAISQALQQEDRKATESAAGAFTEHLLRALRVSLVDVKVLAKRPSNRWGELHGLYEPSDGRARPLLTVWMRTAQRKEVVAFKTFLRTLLHEIGHHLDYELLGLEDSFHTQGFYQRESSLYHQLVPDGEAGSGTSRATRRATAPSRPAARKASASRSGAATRPGAKTTKATKTTATKKPTKSKGTSEHVASTSESKQKKREPVQGSLFD